MKVVQIFSLRSISVVHAVPERQPLDQALPGLPVCNKTQNTLLLPKLSLISLLLCAAAIHAIAYSGLTVAAAHHTAQHQFVYGIQNAEDLVRMTTAGWVIASHMNFEVSDNAAQWRAGPLKAIGIDTHEVLQIFPAAGATIDWDRSTFPECAAPPENFSSHGLTIQARGLHGERIYAINHGDRESVEVIDIKAGRTGLIATWRGCVHAPRGAALNSVTALPDGAIVVSIQNGTPAGVAKWLPGRGWMEIRGIKGSPNGIEASRDGRWLFVNLIDERLIVRIPSEGGEARPILHTDFYPENLHWGDDGYLYTAGYAEDTDVASCLKKRVCDSGFTIVRIDPNTLTTKEMYRSGGLKGEFGFATVALRLGNNFWVSSMIADRVLILPANESNTGT